MSSIQFRIMANYLQGKNLDKLKGTIYFSRLIYICRTYAEGNALDQTVP